MTLSELKSRTNDVFSSIVVFCPNFPAEAQTNTAKKFDELTEMVCSVIERTRSDDAKQWLRICLQEIDQSRKCYEQGDSRNGVYVIQRAQEHFKAAFSKKPIAARFVVGESGPARDENSGFME